jgi:hypothetical protein
VKKAGKEREMKLKIHRNVYNKIKIPASHQPEIMILKLYAFFQSIYT